MRYADLDPATRTELEAAAFRRLVAHMRTRTDVQNIDLMNMAGFCRNCLSNWLKDAAAERDVPLRQGGEPRGGVRHALRGVQGAPPGRGEPRAEGRLREEQAGALTTGRRLASVRPRPCARVRGSS